MHNNKYKQGMRKLIYTVALVVMGITASYAQRPGGPREGGPKQSNETSEQRAEKHAIRLQTDLGLTADQKAKVKAVELDRIKKSDDWRKKDDADRKSKMDERQAFMKASTDKLNAILTPEQKTKFEASRKERGANFRDGDRPRGPRPPRGEKGPQGDKITPPANN